MSAVAEFRSPAVVRSMSLDHARGRSFLADVVVEHGPKAELARVFLRADNDLREAGVRLEFAGFDELCAINRANRASWSPLVPLFDPALNDLDDQNGQVVIGRSESGEPVVTAAARLYELHAETLADRIESLRIFYQDPHASALPGEAIRVSSEVARSTRRRAVFSGAAWVHPDWRKKSLIDAVAPVIRGLGLTRWMPDLTFSFMVPALVRNGTARRWYMNVDWEITMINTPVKRGETIHAALSWTTPDLTLKHFADFLGARRDASTANAGARPRTSAAGQSAS